MRQLVDAGLITREQRGKWAYYRLVHSALVAVAGALSLLEMVGAEQPLSAHLATVASGQSR